VQNTLKFDYTGDWQRDISLVVFLSVKKSLHRPFLYRT